LKQSLTYQDEQWRQAFGQRLATGIAAASQIQQNQAAVNAYNYRTQVLSQPQQVNVNYSGSVNQNINYTGTDTIYLHNYNY
jgi:hypothetical protein